MRWTILLMAAAGLCGQTLTFEEYEPTSTLVVPEHQVAKAKYPFIDVHLHQTRCVTPACVSKLLEDMEKVNMAVMVTSPVRGGGGARFLEFSSAQKGKHPKRFAAFTNLDESNLDAPDYPDRAARQLEEDIKAGAQGLKVWKHLGMNVKDSGGHRIPLDDPRFDKAFEVCGKHGIPVLIHTADPKPFWDPMDKTNERWLELKTHPRRNASELEVKWQTLIDEQRRLFARHPKTKFINAHFGWQAHNLGELSQWMEKLPNMYLEIAAVLGELGRQPRAARAFFIKYQDRIMFGKDTWSIPEYPYYFRMLETADEYFPHLRRYQAFWNVYGLDLPDPVLRKVYYQNALKVIPGIEAGGFSR
ncbi:MAG: amidohydrolase family protein [Bryobacteraceae bacterium]